MAGASRAPGDQVRAPNRRSSRSPASQSGRDQASDIKRLGGSPRYTPPMCTIVVLRGLHPEFPLILATNRDEFYARASSGPGRLLQAPSTVGGRDLQAQGTWMGVTRDGLFVGVTNQRTLRPPDPSKRSRGELVMQALALGTPTAIREFVRGLDGRAYNGFNLMFGNARSLYVAYGRESAQEIAVDAVPEGIHVLPNDRLDSADFWKVTRAKQLLADAPGADWEALSATLKTLLSDAALPPLDALPELPPDAPFDKLLLQRLAALCVRTPAYGTRSSTLVALRAGAVGHYLYADGPPDQTPFVDVTELF
jgi:uncharacterized protein with NRDE domain